MHWLIVIIFGVNRGSPAVAIAIESGSTVKHPPSGSTLIQVNAQKLTERQIGQVPPFSLKKSTAGPLSER